MDFSARNGTIQIVSKDATQTKGLETIELFNFVVDKNRHKLVLHNVLYVPDVTYNLISIRVARKNSFPIVVDGEQKGL